MHLKTAEARQKAEVFPEPARAPGPVPAPPEVRPNRIAIPVRDPDDIVPSGVTIAVKGLQRTGGGA